MAVWRFARSAPMPGDQQCEMPSTTSSHFATERTSAPPAPSRSTIAARRPVPRETKDSPRRSAPALASVSLAEVEWIGVVTTSSKPD